MVVIDLGNPELYNFVKLCLLKSKSLKYKYNHDPMTIVIVFIDLIAIEREDS